MASLWKLPLVVVLEDNEWAQSTPSSANLAGSMCDRFAAFGFPVFEIDSTDVEELHAVAGRALAEARTQDGPVAIVIHTYRLCHHSKDDDYRPADEVAARWVLDPLKIQSRRLDLSVRAAIDAEVESVTTGRHRTGPGAMIAARAMGDALRAALEEDHRVILLGEDLADSYGGAFKVTRGLSTDFPGRVRSTPISEGAIVSLSAGLVLSGYRPIIEIMFGDFLPCVSTRSSTT